MENRKVEILKLKKKVKRDINAFRILIKMTMYSPASNEQGQEK